MGDQFTEEAYAGRKQYFQLRHLTPFASVLSGKYKELYDQLCKENPKAVGDDDFISYDRVRARREVREVPNRPQNLRPWERMNWFRS